MRAKLSAASIGSDHLNGCKLRLASRQSVSGPPRHHGLAMLCRSLDRAASSLGRLGGLGRGGSGLRGGQSLLKPLSFFLVTLFLSVDLVGAIPGFGVSLGVKLARHQQILKVENVRLVPFVIRKLELWSILMASNGQYSEQRPQFMHTSMSIKKSSGSGTGPLGAFGVAHPDALRWADLRANIARGAPDVAVVGVVDEHWQETKSLVNRQPLVGIFDGEKPGGLEPGVTVGSLPRSGVRNRGR